MCVCIYRKEGEKRKWIEMNTTPYFSSSSLEGGTLSLLIPSIAISFLSASYDTFVNLTRTLFCGKHYSAVHAAKGVKRLICSGKRVKRENAEEEW